MLLSMYLLYRFARSEASRSYVFDIGLFFVLVSLVCAIFPVTEFVFFWPFSLLSFPFYFWVGELRAPVAVREVLPWVNWLPYHSVRFLSFDLNLTPDWELSGNGVSTYSAFQNYGNALVVAFSVLLLVNVLGGVVGYVVGKKCRVSGLSEERWLAVGIVSVVLSYFLGIVAAQVSDAAGLFVAVMFSGFGAVVLEIVALSFLVDYVKHARVGTLMVLSGLVLRLSGEYMGQVLMITVGSTLVVFGGVVYFFKLVIRRERQHESQLARSEAGVGES